MAQKTQTAEEILANAKAQEEKIVAEAKAEAAKIVAEAKAQVGAATKDPEDLVYVRLFKDGDKYKDDVFVAVNGRAYQIQRGVTVKVPRYVADVLEQSMEQDNATANLIEQESSSYEADARARKLL